jgi:hypothetical protein
MNFDELLQFVERDMRMSHVYQPVMLRELLNRNVPNPKPGRPTLQSEARIQERRRFQPYLPGICAESGAKNTELF